MSSIINKINKLEKEVVDKTAEILKLKALLESFPDLETYSGRWDKEVYCSPSVNTLVTSYDSRHNCGCCSDSPLEIWLYMDTPLGKVYSKPAMFFVGERSYHGDVSFLGWEDNFRKYNIPEHIIAKIALRFKKEELDPDEEEDFDE